MDIKETLTRLSVMGTETGVRSQASAYFENNKDMLAASDFESAMRLGCFDKEFTYYGVGYTDVQGKIAYRISSQSARLYRFSRSCAVEGLLPTPVVRYTVRRPSPSGHEDLIKVETKKDCARKIRSIYNADYFQAIDDVLRSPGSDAAAEILDELKDALTGVYDSDLLQQFEGLVLIALEARQITPQRAVAYNKWLTDIRRQMEDDIVVKSQCKKVLSGFQYRAGDSWRTFWDARREVVEEARQAKILDGIECTTVISKDYWLREMSEFPAVREKFVKELEGGLSGVYRDYYDVIRQLPPAVSGDLFEEREVFVKDHCSEEAAKAFSSLRVRWNLL